MTIRRQAQPRIALDPYGQGVHVLLPAVGDTPAGVARWRITADGDTHTVQSRAMWVGAAETTPQTAYPLDRPVRTVLVSLAGHEDLAAELRVVDQADPVLFFTEDGRRLAGTVSLPRSQVWIMHPADRELEFTGQAGQIVEPTVPLAGTAGGCASSRWRTCRPSACRAAARIRSKSRPGRGCLLDDPLPGVATPFGSPVYAVPPRLQLPQNAGADIRWYAEIRRAGGGAPLAGRALDPADEIDIWEGIPRPVLGAFEVTVRGPLGRGLRRTIFVAEGLSVGYQPQVRPLTGIGLAPGTGQLVRRNRRDGAARYPCASARVERDPPRRVPHRPRSPSRSSSPRRMSRCCAQAQASRPGRRPSSTWSPRTSPTPAACWSASRPAREPGSPAEPARAGSSRPRAAGSGHRGERPAASWAGRVRAGPRR